ncbi:MAG: hypothetical protein K6G66_00210 [Oscillospiraceae bacterium]|nr:hypothetical protein [Oscillospiraceae bacterium]
MKKTLSLLLVLALFMSIGLSAWAAPVRASDESTAEQIYLILAQFDSLKQDGGSDAWLYAVTDLDHNGRLELIAAPAQGGIQPCVWEAGTDGKTLSACTISRTGDQPFPAITVNNADTYYDQASDTWHYAFNAHREVSANEVYDSKCAVSLVNGAVSSEVFATAHSTFSNNAVNVTYTGKDGAAITGDAFNAAADAAYPGTVKCSTNFYWFHASEANASRLMDSYAAFKGALLSQKPSPAAGAAPVAGNFLMITKNPTNESRAIGDTAWFVAEASGWTGAEWTFVSPAGQSFSVSGFTSLFPAARVNGSDTGSLSISNVSSDMTGWGAYCTFRGNGGQTARSNTAYMYVFAKYSGAATAADGSTIYYYYYYPVREYEVYWDYVPGLIWYYPDLGDDFPWLALQYLHDNNDDAALAMIAQYYNIPETDASYEMLRQYLTANDNDAVMEMLRQYADNDVITPNFYSQYLPNDYSGGGSWNNGVYSGGSWGGGSFNDGSFGGGGSFSDGSVSGGGSFNDGSFSGGGSWGDGSVSGGGSWDDGSVSGGGSWDDGVYSGGGSWDDGVYSGGGSWGNPYVEDGTVPEQYSPYYGWGDFNQADEEYLLLLRQQQGGDSY